ncbi:MAG: Lrp/AsnC family transcriptional regulator [Nanoarchaeota archaeon]
MDLKDKKLLYELDKNSRQSSAQISKNIRLNKNTTNFRINKLVKENYISGFYPSIDISKLGFFAFRVYFKFVNTNSLKERAILETLKSNKIVGVIAELESVYDIMFMAIVEDIYKFDNFWRVFKEKYRKYFWQDKISVMTKVIHL